MRDFHEVEKQLMKQGALFGGTFDVVCRDKNGKVKWNEVAKNIVVDTGLNHILAIVFHGNTQVTQWWVGLKGSGAASSGDTLASPVNWTEESGYTGNRKIYTEATPSNQSITNSASKATFGITSTATIAGAFLCSVSSGTGGLLMCDADFSSAKGVSTNDTLEVTYTLSAADDGA